MRFIIIILCVVIQRFGWVNPGLWTSDLWDRYLAFWMRISNHTPFSKGYVGLIVMIFVPIVVMAILLLLCDRVFGGVGYFIVSFLILWLVMDAYHWFSDDTSSSWMSDSIRGHWSSTLSPQLILKTLWPAHQQMFAVIFWFALGGPMVVFGYMTIIVVLQRLRIQPELNHSLCDAAEWLYAVIDWLPQRLLAFSFSLVGEFSTTFTYWRQHVGGHLQKSSDIVMCCSERALGEYVILGSDNHMKREQLISLLNRTLWLYLTTLAVLVITIFW